MHCPICSRDINHLQRHLRQKHASPNPAQRVNTMETSKAGYIYKRYKQKQWFMYILFANFFLLIYLVDDLYMCLFYH